MDIFHRRKGNLPMPGPSGTSTLAVAAQAGQWPSDGRLEPHGLCQCQGPAWHCTGSGAAHTSGGRTSPGCIHTSQGLPSAVQLLWAGAVHVAPSPCFDPHRGAGAQPCLAEPAATQSSGHSTQCPKRKNPWVTEDDEVCLHKDSAHPLDSELSRGSRILLPGNSIPAPTPTQVRGCRQHCFSFFSPLFLMSAPSSGCCTGGNLVPTLDWLPGACGIPVCVGLALLACLSLSSSFFPRNKTSSFLQPIKLLVLRKQERWLLMS